MKPSNDIAVFYSGSISLSGSLYRGFIATQATVVDSIAWGDDDPIVSLSPKMTVAAGTDVNVKLSAIEATGSIVLYK
jgi:hypothetical protein